MFQNILYYLEIIGNIKVVRSTTFEHILEYSRIFRIMLDYAVFEIPAYIHLPPQFII
jgi:hypothetical protein